jgi:hypothetical protein
MSTKEAPRHEWEPDPDERRDAIVFDSFARRAGASLRSAAPEHEIAAVVRRGNRRQTRRLVAEIGAVSVLILSGIVVLTRSDGTQRNVDVPPVTTIEIVRADDPRVDQWFLDYTGNSAGVAAGQPVKFGVVMPSYTYQHDLGVAATYLNERAGGVGGRPIVLDVCQQALSECADRFAADPTIIAVLENQWSGDSIGAALAGRKPLHTSYSGGGTEGVEYYPTYRETVNAMALQAKALTAPGAQILVIDAAVTHLDDPSLTAFVTPDISPTLADRDVITVKASTTEHLADTIHRVGATDATAIVLVTPPIDQFFTVPVRGHLICEDLSDSLGELGMSPVVIVDGCAPHEGWYRLDLGYNETSPDLQSGALPISTKMPGLGAAKGTAAARGIREVGAFLAVIRVINQLGGPAAAIPAALDQAMRDFAGPLPLGAGPLDCTPTGKVAERVQPGSCVRFVDVHQFVHDTWIDKAPIDLGT